LILSDLRVSVEVIVAGKIHHGDTEITELLLPRDQLSLMLARSQSKKLNHPLLQVVLTGIK